jgi:hypothetical protein
MKEVWKTIDGFENYAVSNLGRVKRINNSGTSSAGKILKPHRPTKDKPEKEYYRNVLYANGKRYSIATHHLVLEAFVCKRPEGMETNHIDSCRTNNRLDNLEWCTPSENVRHAVKNKRRTQRGAAIGTVKLTEEKVLEIDAILKSGEEYSLTEIGKKYNVNKCTIYDIRRGATWAWLTGN